MSSRARKARAASPGSGSVHLLTLGRRKDAHQLAVLGHRAPGDVDLLLAEHFGDVLIAERLLRVFLGDDLPDLLLHAFGGDFRPVPSAQARREKVLELEGALGSVDVLAGGGAADGRLVHADVVGYVL